MENNEHIVRFTAVEIETMRARGEDRIKDERLDAMTKEKLEASIDHEEEGDINWSTIQVGFPGTKERVTVRLDFNVVEWFKRQGPGYQTRMNEVRKSCLASREEKAARSPKRPWSPFKRVWQREYLISHRFAF